MLLLIARMSLVIAKVLLIVAKVSLISENPYISKKFDLTKKIIINIFIN